MRGLPEGRRACGVCVTGASGGCWCGRRMSCARARACQSKPRDLVWSRRRIATGLAAKCSLPEIRLRQNARAKCSLHRFLFVREMARHHLSFELLGAARGHLGRSHMLHGNKDKRLHVRRAGCLAAGRNRAEPRCRFLANFLTFREHSLCPFVSFQ